MKVSLKSEIVFLASFTFLDRPFAIFSSYVFAINILLNQLLLFDFSFNSWNEGVECILLEFSTLFSLNNQINYNLSWNAIFIPQFCNCWTLIDSPTLYPCMIIISHLLSLNIDLAWLLWARKHFGESQIISINEIC